MVGEGGEAGRDVETLEWCIKEKEIIEIIIQSPWGPSFGFCYRTCHSESP